MKVRYVALFIALTLFNFYQAHGQLAGQECFPRKENKLVYDEANLLSADDEMLLEQMLDDFSDSTSNQITVVIVPDLCGMDKAQFAIELGEAWGVGQSAVDNGIVMLVKPKTTDSKGEMFIAVGRGLEGAIPDITAKGITENECIPAFKQNDYSGGIAAGCSVLMKLAQGEYNSDEYASKNKRKPSGRHIGIILFFFLILAILFGSKVSQARRYAKTNQLGFWAAWALLNAATRSHRGYYSNFSSGRGSFGSGGGFGGFGGGGFGGGGAGGSW